MRFGMFGQGWLKDEMLGLAFNAVGARLAIKSSLREFLNG